jgi:hypothetical protein
MKLRGRLAALTFASAAIVYVALLAVGAVASPQDDSYSSTQTTMRGVFLTLSKAYKYSLDAEAFESPANRNEIHNTLEALVANASDLESHGTELDPSFDYLKRSLSRDANEALGRFEAGQYMGSRWALNKITENCVSCHSKLPTESQTVLTEGFLGDEDIKAMDPLAHAELALALRQFDTALTEYEEVLTDRSMSPRDIMMPYSFTRSRVEMRMVFSMTATTMRKKNQSMTSPPILSRVIICTISGRSSFHELTSRSSPPRAVLSRFVVSSARLKSLR